MAKQIPIPQNPIGENFVWRDWFQKLSNRVFGSIGSQDANAVFITGGTIDSTPIGSNTPSSGSFTTLTASTSLPITSGGTGASTASVARTNLGLGSGYSGSVALAKLTLTGANGSLTVVNGIITAYTAPT
jgi:hydroxymethylpyrimidine/phosphomethylpyrimidine kinase